MEAEGEDERVAAPDDAEAEPEEAAADDAFRIVGGAILSNALLTQAESAAAKADADGIGLEESKALWAAAEQDEGDTKIREVNYRTVAHMLKVCKLDVMARTFLAESLKFAEKLAKDEAKISAKQASAEAKLASPGRGTPVKSPGKPAGSPKPEAAKSPSAGRRLSAATPFDEVARIEKALEKATTVAQVERLTRQLQKAMGLAPEKPTAMAKSAAVVQEVQEEPEGEVDSVRMADSQGYEGTYTGPVTESKTPHGKGQLRYDTDELFVGKFVVGEMEEGVLYKGLDGQDAMRKGKWLGVISGPMLKAWKLSPAQLAEQKRKARTKRKKKLVDGVRLDKELLDIAEAATAAADGAMLGVKEAKKLWESAQDGEPINPTERQTLLHILGEFEFSRAAEKFINQHIAKDVVASGKADKGVSPPGTPRKRPAASPGRGFSTGALTSPELRPGTPEPVAEEAIFKIVDGVRYDRELMDMAEADGSTIVLATAKKLWQTALGGPGVTDTERRTLQYILSSFKLDAKAKKFLESHVGEDDAEPPTLLLPEAAVRPKAAAKRGVKRRPSAPAPAVEEEDDADDDAPRRPLTRAAKRRALEEEKVAKAKAAEEAEEEEAEEEEEVEDEEEEEEDEDDQEEEEHQEVPRPKASRRSSSSAVAKAKAKTKATPKPKAARQAKAKGKRIAMAKAKSKAAAKASAAAKKRPAMAATSAASAGKKKPTASSAASSTTHKRPAASRKR
eukprot:TRINITY_DN33697_c0_g1_i1.p1 TRINITY_DN33697_c0_g1~~TRINITY_DN33697_c0_g1_i1.p1  ORF type:complete len:734 (-),score=283.69 TRINITY_DN33697_c0_g1_i1:125-2326(-)